MLLRGVGLTPLRPLPPPLLTSASSLPICLIGAMRTISLDPRSRPRSHGPENARNHAKDDEIRARIGREEEEQEERRAWTISSAVGGTRGFDHDSISRVLSMISSVLKDLLSPRERGAVSLSPSFAWRFQSYLQ